MSGRTVSWTDPGSQGDSMVHSATPAPDPASEAPMRRRLTASFVICAIAALTLAPATVATKPPSTGSTGSGTVFFPNPVAQLGIQTLTDQKDADYAALAAGLPQIVTLTNLDGSGYLVGDWANIRARRATPAYLADQHVQLPPQRRPLRAGHGLLLGHRGAEVHPAPRLRRHAPAPSTRNRRTSGSTSGAWTTRSRGTSTTCCGSARAESTTPRTRR